MSVRKISSMAAPCSSANVAEQLLVADWDQLHSVDQTMKFNGGTGLSSYNVGVLESQGIEKIPSFSCFGNESLSEIMGSFALPESTQMAIAVCPQDFPSTNEYGIEKNLKGKRRKKMPDCGALQSHSPLVRIQNVEAEQPKDIPSDNAKSSMERDVKKLKVELSPGVKEHPQSSSDAAKEDYMHVRAKRGQATNSHSLAERVRREKISERMRFLQDLVPGCNKITGKAVMLDEIINYVQSLQKQVEFLSMKLATVNPELNLDIEQMFTKENLHSRYGSSSAFGYGQEVGSSHPHSHGSAPQGVTQAEMVIPSISNSRDMFRTTTHQISPMAQISNAWDDEFQNAVQMGFIPNLPLDTLELNGSMKAEL